MSLRNGLVWLLFVALPALGADTEVNVTNLTSASSMANTDTFLVRTGATKALRVIGPMLTPSAGSNVVGAVAAATTANTTTNKVGIGTNNITTSGFNLQGFHGTNALLTLNPIVSGLGPAILGMGSSDDPVVSWGYNWKPDFTIIVTNQPGAAWVIEGNYTNGPNVYAESYFQWHNSDGDPTHYRRPFYATYDKLKDFPIEATLSGDGTNGVSLWSNTGTGTAGTAAYMLGTLIGRFSTVGIELNKPVVTELVATSGVGIGNTNVTGLQLSVFGSGDLQYIWGTNDAAFASLVLKDGATASRLYQFGSTYSTSGRLLANSLLVDGAYGLGLAAGSATGSGDITFYNATSQTMKLSSSALTVNTNIIGLGGSNYFAGPTVFGSSVTVNGDGTGTTTLSNLNVSGAAWFTNGLSSDSAVYDYSGSSDSPGSNQLVKASWVRSLFNVGAAYYVSTNISVGTNAGAAGQYLYSYQSTIPISDVRTYTAANFLTNGGYIGASVTTNTFSQINGAVTVNSFLGFRGASGSITLRIHPELYIGYDRTNWIYEFTASPQTITHGTTNLYQWVIDVPSYSTTNAAGFYVQRRFKVDSVTGSGTPTLDLLIGTNVVSGVSDASHVTMPSPTATTGNAYLANNQNWTGTNYFGGGLGSGSFPSIKTNGQVLATITLGQFQRTNTANAITITGLTGATGNESLSGVLVVSNSAAASVLVTWPVEWITPLGPNISAYCTNAEAMLISVNCLPGVMTNAAIIRTRKGSSGVAP